MIEEGTQQKSQQKQHKQKKMSTAPSASAVAPAESATVPSEDVLTMLLSNLPNEGNFAQDERYVVPVVHRSLQKLG